ncbi:MAG: LysE family translocator [Bacteroidetes bacterium]|nr:MAG: LysE family translocator [Bacteroidota bacterium]TNE98798.1 MAG: LysE family translocator [Bacteroidota bacterium]
MDIVIKGFLTGCVLSIMIGPVFFVLLETSIKRGVKAAVAFDLGVLLNDIVYIFIAYVFYNQVEELSHGENNSLVRIIGGLLFVVYGVINFFKKVHDSAVDDVFNLNVRKRDYLLLFVKGFLLNLANPLVVFYWFSVMTLGAGYTEGGHDHYTMFVFFGTILATFFSVDFLKIIGAKQLQPLVTHKRLVMLNRLIGIIFVASGIFLISQGIMNF